MPLRERTYEVGSEQAVSGVLALPSGAARDTVVILAHGAGSDMTSPFLCAVHEGLAQHGFPSVKFNFPYKERGGKAPDHASVLERCWLRVIEAVRRDPEIGARRVVIGGKSMGGRMASHVAARGADVDGLVFLGYPLHPPGKTEKLRTAHLGEITVPMLFFAGTRDSLCKLDLLKSSIAGLKAPITLKVIDGGDHSFKLLKSMKRDQAEVLKEIVDDTASWLNNTDAKPSKSK